MKCVKMSSINQMSQAIRDLQNNYKFVGVDEEDKAIFDNTIRLPEVTALGSVKLHGTNAGIQFNLVTGEVKPQKKSDFITPEKDNFGFASWFETRREDITKILDEFTDEIFAEDTSPFGTEQMFTSNAITVYGEWAGQGIQKGVGISEFKKSFYVFGVKVTGEIEEDGETKETSYWVNPKLFKDIELKNPELGIFNVWNFKQYEVIIDLNVPNTAIDEISKIVDEVENDDPVVKELEKIYETETESKIGEGVVWTLEGKNGEMISFKSKGEKHSKSKVKKFKKVDSALENRKRELAEKVTPGWRLNQGIQEVFGEDIRNTFNRKMMGEVIKWTMKDIIKEELGTIAEAELELKQIQGYITQRVREHFFNVEKEII